nr:MAG TPA: hypothetical protein [Bacteriophage sp.]
MCFLLLFINLWFIIVSTIEYHINCRLGVLIKH